MILCGAVAVAKKEISVTSKESDQPLRLPFEFILIFIFQLHLPAVRRMIVMQIPSVPMFSTVTNVNANLDIPTFLMVSQSDLV